MSIKRWLQQRRLRKTQEQYAYWKAKVEALQRLGDTHLLWKANEYTEACGQMAKYNERIEILMRQ